jgi:putative transposase
MKRVLTAKLKLLTTPEQFQALRQTQLAYRDALNYVSQYSFAHGKKSNQQSGCSAGATTTFACGSGFPPK